MKIVLGPEELELERLVHEAREVAALIQGRMNAHGREDDSHTGFGAELAFWQYSGYQAKLNAVVLLPRLSDIDSDILWDGVRVQIRSTKHRGGHLIVHPGEDPDAHYVLIIENQHDYEIVGYIKGSDAQVEEFVRDPDPRGERNYWVPQGRLEKL